MSLSGEEKFGFFLIKYPNYCLYFGLGWILLSVTRNKANLRMNGGP